MLQDWDYEEEGIGHGSLMGDDAWMGELLQLRSSTSLDTKGDTVMLTTYNRTSQYLWDQVEPDSSQPRLDREHSEDLIALIEDRYSTVMDRPIM